MIPSHVTPSGRARLFVAATVSVLGLSLFAVPVLPAAEPAAPPAAKPGAALPLRATFEKTTHTEEGMPYVLKLVNDSAAPLTVSAKVLASVTVHNAEKVHHLPAHTIKAGHTWTIPNLAALDRVTLTADGFAPLELTVK